MGLGPLSPDRGVHFDEGMTDYLTQDVMIEYVRRVGAIDDVSVKDVVRYIELFRDQDAAKNVLGYKTPSYRREVRIVRLLIHGLANVLDTDPQEIKNAFVRAKLRSGKIFSDDLKAYFKQAGLGRLYKQLELFNKQKWNHPESHKEKDERFAKIEPALKEIVPVEVYNRLSVGWDT